MRVVVQSYADGELRLVEVPDPNPRLGHLLVATRVSVVSLGTERAMMEVARKGLLGKALSRPDWVKQVLEKVRIEGLAEAYRQSRARLDFPVPLGYSSSGVVLEVGAGVTGFAAGDRVACAGSGYASHAEQAVVPHNFCTAIPDGVAFEDAAYVALGGIALEAVRVAHAEVGHRVVVIGAGLLGQLAVQILAGAGCHVLAVDLSPEKCRLALSQGAERAALVDQENVPALVTEWTGGEGADSALILASAESNQPLELAAQVCRERGRVVATGLVGLQIPRKVFYEKELNLVVSRGWGPGMYDADYAERGMKYPPTYARWTAQRNLAEFLALVAKGRVKPSVLTTHRFAFDQALRAYELILSRKEPVLGVVLTYLELGQAREPVRVIRLGRQRTGPTREGDIGVGLVGAGLYARGTLMPALAKVRGVRLVGVATAGGLSGHHVGERFGFEYCTTDHAKLLEDEKVEAVFVLTRHNSHAELASEALRAGKAVFVEKPLAISGEQLEQLIATYNGLSEEGRRPFLMVGFNRRFSPAAAQARRFVGASGDSAVVLIRCNAGPVPADSWVHHPEEGGGQIVGEVCHFVDLLQYLTGGRPQRVFAAAAPTPGHTRDALCISLQMDNGAAGSIVYAANGDRAFPRERVEVFAHGGVFVIDNFRSTETVIGGRRRRRRGWAVDRGHRAELEAFFAALRDGGEPPVPFESYVATTLATFAVETSISRGEAVTVPECLVVPEEGA